MARYKRSPRRLEVSGRRVFLFDREETALSDPVLRDLELLKVPQAINAVTGFADTSEGAVNLTRAQITDVVIGEMERRVGPGQRFAQAGETIAFSTVNAATFKAGECPGTRSGELLAALDAIGVACGVAVYEGQGADGLGVVARSAVEAYLAAREIDKVLAENRKTRDLKDVEAVWDVLGFGAQVALRLREENHLIACAIGLRGRGRLIGPLSGERLIRFGVSKWQ